MSTEGKLDMPLTELQLMELYDEKLLHDNLMRYARAADRSDIEGVRETYWPDAFDDHGLYVGSASGWADWIEAFMDKSNQLAGSHHVSNVLCEIDGNRAKRESMFLCLNTIREPDVTVMHGGRYRDLCEKRDGEWKVLYRTCVWDWCDARKLKPDWSLNGLPEITNWGASYPDDPIYKNWAASEPTPRPPHQAPVR